MSSVSQSEGDDPIDEDDKYARTSALDNLLELLQKGRVKKVIEIVTDNRFTSRAANENTGDGVCLVLQTALSDAPDALKLMEAVLTKNADVNVQSKNGITPLHIAVQKQKDSGLLELLLSSKASLDLVQSEGYTPLHCAALSSNLVAMKTLLDAKASIDVANKEGATPLQCAAYVNSTVAVKTLLEAKASVNQGNKEKSGNTPLHEASSKGSSSIVEILLDAKTFVDSSTATKTTPLMLAAYAGHFEIVQSLLNAKASVHLQMNDGRSPLLAAAQSGSADIMNSLIRSKASVDLAMDDGATPLFWAAKNGHFDVLSILLEAKADLNTSEKRGATPLLVASQNGHTDIVESLLEAKSSVDHPTNLGHTPLFLAAQNGHSDIVDKLLERRALVNFSTNEGIMPITIAAKNGHSEVVQSLLGANASVDYQKNASTFFWSIRQGTLDQIDNFIASGGDINAKEEGKTALFFASSQDFPKVVTRLLKRNADPTIGSRIRQKKPIWKDLPGRNAFQVSIGGRMQCVCTHDNQDIYKLQEDDTWKQLPGKATSVGIGYDGEMWAIQQFGEIFRWDSGDWVKIEGQAKFIDVGSAKHIVATQANGDMYGWVVQTRTWLKLEGKSVQASIGSDGDIWCVTADRSIYRLQNMKWVQAPGYGDQISVGDCNNVYVTNPDGVFRWTKDEFEHQLIVGRVAHLRVARDGTLARINADGTTSIGSEVYQENVTPLMIAATNNNIKCIKELIRGPADLNRTDSGGRTALYRAIFDSAKESIECASLLISSSANVNIVNDEEESPLHVAILAQNLDLVQQLISAKSDINLKDKTGATPLHTALFQDLSIFEFIAKHPIIDEFDFSDHTNGQTICDYAILHETKPLEMLQLIEPYFVFAEAQFVQYFDISDIKILDSGNFGVVYKAQLKVGTTTTGLDAKVSVVCKISKIEAGANEWHELQILSNLPYHQNVLGLLALCTGFDVEDTPSKSTAMIIKFKPGGALISHLKKRRCRMKLLRLAEFGVGMAKGLYHLHENGYKHSDVAARNFLLNELETDNGSERNQRLSLTDFGLSRPIHFQPDKPPPLPIRWLAPEVLETKGTMMTTSSDIWMLGVTFWEMCFFPYRHPYLGIKEPNQILSHLNYGGHLSFSYGFYSEWKAVILDCCQLDADKRPTAKQLHENLKQLSVTWKSGDDQHADSNSELKTECAGSDYVSDFDSDDDPPPVEYDTTDPTYSGYYETAQTETDNEYMEYAGVDEQIDDQYTTVEREPEAGEQPSNCTTYDDVDQPNLDAPPKTEETRNGKIQVEEAKDTYDVVEATLQDAQDTLGTQKVQDTSDKEMEFSDLYSQYSPDADAEFYVDFEDSDADNNDVAENVAFTTAAQKGSLVASLKDVLDKLSAAELREIKDLCSQELSVRGATAKHAKKLSLTQYLENL